MMMRKYVSKCHKCTTINEKNEIYYTLHVCRKKKIASIVDNESFHHKIASKLTLKQSEG